jgi:hypothetical protein
MLFTATIGGKSTPLVGLENKNGVYYAFDRDDLAAGPVWIYVAEDSAALNSAACEDINTISTSAWAGEGAPVMVAGIATRGSSCVGTLAALNPESGQPEWIVPLQSPVLGAVTEVPGLVAVGAGSYLDLLSSADGATAFSYHESRSNKHLSGYGAPVGWFWAPPTIAGNSLYAGNQDGTLRSFSL